MIGIRWILVPLAALVLTSGTGAGGPGAFAKKPKSEAQVKRLIETVRTDPDEKRRRAALAELQDADPRTHPDVISALIAVLQKDASAQIRGEAAEAIGQFKIVYPVAGLSLEAAAELDPSKAVRENAQQALWEYHLAGYRSLRGSGGIVGQTAEPPLARPASRPAVAPAAGGGGADNLDPKPGVPSAGGRAAIVRRATPGQFPTADDAWPGDFTPPHVQPHRNLASISSHGNRVQGVRDGPPPAIEPHAGAAAREGPGLCHRSGPDLFGSADRIAGRRSLPTAADLRTAGRTARSATHRSGESTSKWLRALASRPARSIATSLNA